MYKRMAEGLLLLDANVVELNAEIVEDEDDWEVELPPDFVLIGTLGTEPKSLDDMLMQRSGRRHLTMRLDSSRNLAHGLSRTYQRGTQQYHAVWSSRRSVAPMVKSHPTGCA